MRDNNILSRFIKPAARIIGLPFVNWRCLRTSHATWLKMAGADVKDAQAQLRHSRASTTLDIYQQFVPESQRPAVDRLSQLAPKRPIPNAIKASVFYAHYAHFVPTATFRCDENVTTSLGKEHEVGA